MAKKILTNKQLKAVELMVYSTKQKQEIAEELGISRATISQWVKRDDFQQAIRDEMARSFGQMAFRARKRLDKLIDSNNEGIALAASREVLNKAGYMETQKVEQTVKEINVEIIE